MKNTSIIKTVVISTLLLFFIQVNLFAQQIKSPKATAEGKNVKVTYGQPSKRGRVIFGELVPYGEVWRVGANEATEITFKKNVQIAGKEIKAGTYTLFDIPEKDKWTIIFNSKLEQWGSYNYDETKVYDFFKTDVPVGKISMQEKLTYSFKDNAEGTVLTIAWDEVEVSLTITYK